MISLLFNQMGPVDLKAHPSSAYFRLILMLVVIFPVEYSILKVLNLKMK